MYQAKKNRTGVELYVAAEDRHSLKRLSTPHLLQKVIAHEQLEIRYQPICDHDKISGMEVFIQWPIIDDKILSAMYCMNQIENMGLGQKVNQFILHKAFAQYSQWQSQHEFKLHLNLMLANMLTEGFCGLLEEELKLYAIKPSNLVLEMSEPALKKNADSVGSSLKNLTKLGVVLSIKNFGGHGTGLMMIKDNPIQELKLDSVFSQDLKNDVANQAIVQAANAFCQRLGIFMAVEGLENSDSVGALKGMGIHRYQGNAYCPPLKVEEVNDALSRLG